MSGFRSEHVDVGGTGVEVLSAGAGEPLVFLHGGGVIEGFDCLLPLAERFRLLVPYHPGFGGSGDPPEGAGLDEVVAHYAALLDRLGVDETALVGHSLGGLIAAAFAVAHPDRVRRLVLHAAPGLDVPGHPLANMGALPLEEVYPLLTREESIFAGRLPKPFDDEFLAARAREGRAAGTILVSAFTQPFAASVERLTSPTLLLWGNEDRVVPVEHAAAWHAALPESQLRLYPGRGHLLFHEEPQAIADTAAFTDGEPV